MMNDTPTFKEMLDDYVSVAYRGTLPDPDQRQALLDYVTRLEANQVTPDLIALYRAWQAAEYPNEKFEAMRQVMAELGTIIEGGA